MSEYSKSLWSQGWVWILAGVFVTRNALSILVDIGNGHEPMIDFLLAVFPLVAAVVFFARAHRLAVHFIEVNAEK